MNKIHQNLLRQVHFLTVTSLALMSFGAWASGQTALITYTVDRGDTLENIGSRLLNRADDWREVQRLNKIQDPTGIPVGTRLSIPVALLRPVPLTAEVASTVGVVVADGRILDAKDVGASIAAGSRIQTGPNGKLTVKMPDGSRLRVGPNSDLTLDTLQGYAEQPSQDVVVQLQKGRVESEVKPQKGAAARYRITTPTGVIGVRGTVFRVASSEDAKNAQAEVAEGLVNVSSGQEAKEVPAGFALQLEQGKHLGKTLSLPPAPMLDALPKLVSTPVSRFNLPPLSTGVRYRAIVRHANNPDAIELEEVLDKPMLRVVDLEDGDYILRLRVIDPSGVEGMDAEHAFTQKAHPEAPFLVGPQEKGKVADGDVRFTWAAVSEAATYHFQIAKSSDFSTIVTDTSGLTGVETSANLSAATYFWRVASVRANGDQGPWSQASEVSVRPAPGLAGDPESEDGQLTLRWVGEPNVKYEYEFARDAGFKDIVAKDTVAQSAFSIPLPAPETYYLRLRSIEPDGFVSRWTSGQRIFVPAGFPWGFFLILPLIAL